MDLAITERQGQGEIGGGPFGAQSLELGKGARYVLVEPQIDRPNLFVDARHRATLESGRIENPERCFGDCRSDARAPFDFPAEDLRMQCAHEYRSPPQRDSGIDQSVAQLGQDAVRRRSRMCAVDQPINDGRDFRLSCHAPGLLPYLSRSRTQACL